MGAVSNAIADSARAHGVTIRTSVLVGEMPKGSKVTNWAKDTISAEQLMKDFDAVLLAGGSEQSRDLPVPGRDLAGIHFAMDFLVQQNPFALKVGVVFCKAVLDVKEVTVQHHVPVDHHDVFALRGRDGLVTDLRQPETVVWLPEMDERNRK